MDLVGDSVLAHTSFPDEQHRKFNPFYSRENSEELPHHRRRPNERTVVFPDRVDWWLVFREQVQMAAPELQAHPWAHDGGL